MAVSPNASFNAVPFLTKESTPMEAISTVKWFNSLEDEEKEHFSSRLTKETYPAGKVIATESEPRKTAFIVIEGSIERSKMVGGTKTIVGTASPGDCLGLLHLFGNDPSYATATTLTDTTCYVLTSEKFDEALEQDAKTAKAFMVTLAKQVRTYSKLDRKATGAVDIVLYDSKTYWEEIFNKENTYGFNITYVAQRLSVDTASMALGAQVVCCFVNDDLSAGVLNKLRHAGVKVIAMRCAGFDRVDLNVCAAHGILVVRVPAYSPYAVAEHALALALSLNRKIPRASIRTKEKDFRLEGLLGFDFKGKTAGVVGTGKIGQIFIDLLQGFGMKVICSDPYPQKKLEEEGKATYLPLEEVLAQSDIISLHAPLMPATKHMINKESIAKMKPGVLIINCGRGGLIDTKALIDGLQSGHVGGAGLDVYENESDFFFSDHSDTVCKDEDLAILLQFPNTILTAHQAFFTNEGVGEIAAVSLKNVKLWSDGVIEGHPNAVKAP